jgi:hypothetical protein
VWSIDKHLLDDLVLALQALCPIFSLPWIAPLPLSSGPALLCSLLLGPNIQGALSAVVMGINATGRDGPWKSTFSQCWRLEPKIKVQQRGFLLKPLWHVNNISLFLAPSVYACILVSSYEDTR